MGKNGDLHTHTIHSDGSCAVERNFQLAKQSGLNYLAITDHDYIEDFDRDSKLAEKYGIQAIHGVELSTYDYKVNRRVHILCYMPLTLEPIRKICEETTSRRAVAGLEMARLVAERYPITVEDIQAAAGPSGSIFKQHIMLALMQAGFATEMYGLLWKELFDFKSGSCVRTCVQPDIWSVLPIIRETGGICVMAHPFTYDSIDLLKELLEKRLLDGVEVWSSKSNDEQERYLLDLTRQYTLIPTGGSDFHGSNASKVSPIGCATTPESSIEALFALKERRHREYRMRSHNQDKRENTNGR